MWLVSQQLSQSEFFFLPMLSLIQSEFNRKSNKLESQDASVPGFPPCHLRRVGQVSTLSLFSLL